MVNEAIVLAGGLGTRLRSVVADVPKPMAPIGGRPFLEYLLDYWIDQGIEGFALSVGYRHELIVDHFGDAYRGATLRYVVEKSPLGTGGALLATVAELGIEAPVLLLNGDTFFAVALDRLGAFARRSGADVCFALFETSDQARYLGIEVDPQGRILEPRARQGSPHLANGGVYWLNPKALREFAAKASQPLSFENDLIPVLLRAGRRLYGCAFHDVFIDIGVPEDFRRAQTLLPSNKWIGHATT